MVLWGGKDSVSTFQDMYKYTVPGIQDTEPDVQAYHPYQLYYGIEKVGSTYVYAFRYF